MRLIQLLLALSLAAAATASHAFIYYYEGSPLYGEVTYSGQPRGAMTLDGMKIVLTIEAGLSEGTTLLSSGSVDHWEVYSPFIGSAIKRSDNDSFSGYITIDNGQVVDWSIDLTGYQHGSYPAIHFDAHSSPAGDSVDAAMLFPDPYTAAQWNASVQAANVQASRPWVVIEVPEGDAVLFAVGGLAVIGVSWFRRART